MANEYRDDDLPEEEGTQAKDHEEEIDDILRKMKFGADASAEWVRVACRAADALEHLGVGQALAGLAMMGLIPTDKTPPQHLKTCPACRTIRSAKPAPQVQTLAGMSKKILSNGH
jgi:hypothetical protein